MSPKHQEGPVPISGLEFRQSLASDSHADSYQYAADSGEPVVVHFLRGIDPEQVDRGEFLARAAEYAELSHTGGFVPVVRFGVTDSGLPFVAEEQVSVRPVSRASAHLDISAALHTIISLLGPLETAHRAGFFHTQLAPDSVAVTDRGLVWRDFGPAALSGPMADESEPGFALPWVAPEVFAMRPFDRARADVFSAAALCYSLLVGTAAVLAEGGGARISVPLAHDDGISWSLKRVLITALELDPASRFPTAAALGHALQSVERDLALVETPLVVQGQPFSADMVPEQPDYDRLVERAAAFAVDRDVLQEHGGASDAGASDEAVRTEAVVVALASAGGGPSAARAAPAVSARVPNTDARAATTAQVAAFDDGQDAAVSSLAPSLLSRGQHSDRRFSTRQVWVSTIVIGLVLVIGGLGILVWTMAG